MKKFIATLILFNLPFLVILIVLTLFLVRTNEFTPLSDIVTYHQSGQEYLLGKQYVSFATDPKLALYSATNPTITTLGNSRVLQVRKEFFTSSTSFYNYAQVNSVSNLQNVLERLLAKDATPPRLIVVALEPSYFVRDMPESVNLANDGVMETNWLVVYTKLMKDVLVGKINLSSLFQSYPANDYGVGASTRHTGYRSDGSKQYSPLLLDHTFKQHEDYQFRDSKRRVDKSAGLFTQATDYNQTTLDELEQFLQITKELEIHLVLFFPPYAPTLYEYMQQPTFEYGYQPKIAGAVNELAQNYNLTFTDFSNPATLGVDDIDFYDGYHPKENVLFLTLQHISQKDEILATYLK